MNSNEEGYRKRVKQLCLELIQAAGARRGVKLQHRFCSQSSVEAELSEQGYVLVKIDHTGYIAERKQ
jgi:hypothetical protein